MQPAIHAAPAAENASLLVGEMQAEWAKGGCLQGFSDLLSGHAHVLQYGANISRRNAAPRKSGGNSIMNQPTIISLDARRLIRARTKSSERRLGPGQARSGAGACGALCPPSIAHSIVAASNPGGGAPSTAKRYRPSFMTARNAEATVR